MNVHLIHKYVIPELFPPLLLAFVVLGLASSGRGASGGWFLLVASAAYLPVLLFFVEARLFLPLTPLALVVAGRGLVTVTDGLQAHLSRVPELVRRAIRLQLPAAALVASLLPFTFRPFYREDPNLIYRRAGEWLRDHAAAPATVAFPKTWIAYYAGAARAAVPTAAQDAVAHELRQAGATHLVVDSRIVVARHPELACLLDACRTPRGLTPVRQIEGVDGLRLVIFRVDGPT
jgi:hypothetical protein